MSSELRSTTPLRRHTRHRVIAFSEASADDLAHRIDDYLTQYRVAVVGIAYAVRDHDHHALLTYEENR